MKDLRNREISVGDFCYSTGSRINIWRFGKVVRIKDLKFKQSIRIARCTNIGTLYYSTVWGNRFLSDRVIKVTDFTDQEKEKVKRINNVVKDV